MAGEKKCVMIKLIFVFAVTVFLMVPLSFAQEMGQAKVVEIKGEAQVLKAGAENWAPLQKGAILAEGDSVKTDFDSEVKLELSGSQKTGEVLVRPVSEFKLTTLRYDQSTKTDDTLLDVEMGGILVKAEKLVGDSKFEVKTPISIVGVRGTVFEVNVSAP